MENEFGALPRTARGDVISRSATGLLLVADRNFRSRPSRVRSQEFGGSPIPTDIYYGRATTGIWSSGRRHNPANRIRAISATQRDSVSAEPVQHMPLRWILS